MIDTDKLVENDRFERIEKQLGEFDGYFKALIRQQEQQNRFLNDIIVLLITIGRQTVTERNKGFSKVGTFDRMLKKTTVERNKE